MLLTVTFGFLLLLINGNYGLTVTIFATKQGIIGPSDIQLKCVYTPASGDVVIGISVEEERSSSYVHIASFIPPGQTGDAQLTEEGKILLANRVILTNPTSTSSNGQYEAVITYNETICEDEKRYRCQVVYRNAGGVINTTRSQPASIVVKGRPSIPDSLPTWTPSSGLEEGMEVNFTCTGNVGKPAGKFVWTKYRGSTQYPQGDVTTTAQQIPGTCTSNGTSVLSVQVQAEDNNAVFRCQVEQELANSTMYTQTQPNDFNVYYKVKNIKVTKSPDHPNYAEGTDPIKLTCSAVGNPPLAPNDYTWYNETDMDTPLGTGATFTIQDVRLTRTGNYVCVAKNSFNGKHFNISSLVHIQIDNCLYGDVKGVVFSNGWTCADMISLAPNNCQMFPTKCCASCALATTTLMDEKTTTSNRVYCEDNVFVPDLNRIVKFPVVSFGTVVQSTDICITNKKPLVTAKCDGDPTELKDFIINENCIFQDLNTSTVTKDLQILTTIEIDSGNVKSIIETTKNLTTDPEILTSRDIIYVAEILVPISNISSLDEQTLSDTIDTVDNVLSVTPEKLKIAQDDGSATNRILEVLDMIPRTLDLHGKSKIQIHRENLLMEVYDLSSQAPLVTGIQITDGKTHPLTNSTIQTLIEGTYVNIDKVDAAIVLPVGLLYDSANATRVVMNIFRNWGLFSERSDIKDFEPNSRVISAQISVNGTLIRSLGHDTVQAYFFPRNETNKTECGYWDYNINDFSGGWGTGGCKLNRTQLGRHVCVCDHLTNFAVLINIGGQDTLDDNLAINIISWIGLGLSVAGLSFTVLSFILFKHLRKGRAQQTLFNLALSLLCFLIMFIVGIEKTHNYYGCIVVAALLHYFVLVAFMWMLIEGILQYLGLVKVFPTYIPRFILKTAIPAWGIPLIPVSIVLGLDYRLYRGGDKACWMSTSAFYYAFLTPVATIILVNLIIFVMTLRNILVRHKGLQSNQSEKKRAMTNLRVAFSQFILLGLTWIFGFFTIEEASKIFQYIFTTLNVFQGFFIFLLFTARQKQTRQSWKKLCCKQKPKEKYAKKDKSSDQTSESKS